MHTVADAMFDQYTTFFSALETRQQHMIAFRFPLSRPPSKKKTHFSQVKIFLPAVFHEILMKNQQV